MQGERGEKGESGERGLPAPTMLGWEIDREGYSATPIMSDGSQLSALELRGLFEQFVGECG